MRRIAGFTLIELLLVMAIASLMVVLSGTAVGWYLRRSTEYDVIRQVDAAVRRLPVLASRTGCWARLDVARNGRALILTACGATDMQVQLPPGYRVEGIHPQWQTPPPLNANAAPALQRPAEQPPETFQVWHGPARGWSAARLTLLHDSQPIRTFEWGGGVPSS